MKKIDVIVDEQKVGELFYEQDKNSYGFNYTTNLKPISLIIGSLQNSEKIAR